MNERKLLGLALVLIGGFGGFILGAFMAILPVSDPYTTETQTIKLSCHPVNGSDYACVQAGTRIDYLVCVKSYWWGHVCLTYKTVNSN